jgi:restriction endonuclease Mrr
VAKPSNTADDPTGTGGANPTKTWPALKIDRRAAEKSAVDTQLRDTERRELRRKAREAVLTALRGLDGQGSREAVKARALQDGGFTPRELSAPGAERAGGKATRLVDQQLSWALSDLKREGLVANPARGIWQLTDAARRLHQLQSLPYAEYLDTPEWERTRAAALERAQYACAIDVTHTDGLEVQHRTKERLGAELPNDLVVLCASCLELYQDDAARPRRTGSIPPPVPQSVPQPVIPITAAVERKQGLLRRLRAS